MRTRPKVLLSVSAALFILFLFLYLFLSNLISKNYADFERGIVREDTVRVRDALESRRDDLYTKLGDWAQWDDTYEFIGDGNQDYIDSNLQNSAFEILKVNLIAISDNDGNILFSKNVIAEEAQPFPESLAELVKSHVYFTDSQEDIAHQGVLALPEGTVMFASRPVTTSDGLAEPHGRILFGYFLDDEDRDALSVLTHLNIEIQRYDRAVADPTRSSIIDGLSREDFFVPRVESTAASIAGYTTVPDAHTGEPALLLGAKIPRDIYAQGQASNHLFLWTMAVAGVIITLVVLGLFELTVLRKLSRLERGVIRIRDGGESRGLIDFPDSRDEFRSLAEEMNRSLTSLYQTESRLEEQRNELKKFQLAAEKSYNHLIITDENGIVMYANPAASLNTGYSNAEMMGGKPSLWGKQMPREVYEDMWRTIKTEKKSYSGELLNRRKDGTKYLVSASITPILDDDGQVRYFVGIERDITEERAQRERDRENMQQLESVNGRLASEKARAEGILRYLRSIAEGVFATDRRGMIVFVNDAAAAMIGKTPSDLLGEQSIDFFKFYIGSGKEATRILPSADALKLGHPRPFPREAFLALSESSTLPISGSYAPIVEAEHISGTIIVFHDITKQHELEKMKENFLSIAAHQLRTPLGSMRWTMELLMNGDLGKVPKSAHVALTQLYDNSSRMLTIVKDLLNVSKIEQGRTQEAFAKTDIVNLVGEVVKAMSGAAKKKGQRLSLEKPKANIPELVVTQKHLFEAIENLISNAVRYNRERGSVVVEVRQDKNFVTVSVTDTGIGIPKTDQAKIFSKFYRASNAVSHYTDGSGLGLAVVKSYVEENGGSVSFESEENVGTTFIVHLPIEPKNPIISTSKF
ncbi:MAG: PAS domain S-box protein [Candidatus Moraniibacteriota bacterium]|nr:MAG: PAS domain S-box protein [Candidatus Moranbacteria bacterium]